jgi:hypothetical protein
MHPAATLFLDVGVQRDLWPDGAWPLVSPAEAEQVARLLMLAIELDIRQGAIVCVHGCGRLAAVAGVPPHCETGLPGCDRPAGIALHRRSDALDVASGCNATPDDAVDTARVFDRMTAGIRDAVVFGAGVEHGMSRAVDALLRRRIRTHVALDAAGAGDADLAQRIVAGWKRRGVDGATVATLHRLLGVRN